MLVAPSTKTPSESLPTPFICTSSSVLILRDASDSPSPLGPHNASTSSMKIMAGFCSLAIVKSCFTNLSDSPIHLLTRSDDETEKKVELASVATALARYDLPVPGGPYSKIPETGFLLPLKRCGNLTGKMTASFKASLAGSKPAMSLHGTFGFSLKIELARAPRSFLVSLSLSSSSAPLVFFAFTDPDVALASPV
ncbi:hypothetical protein OGAPHI_004811 [Ogataea philodendri]|uniref:Uncharacterized protein n=1 Tax=Ogataea philodendri TaxID=1378263 RepID=A0A9P8P2P9_9ASCO|nr:uncharacterized protein OGAPHI_004811 [Ogataea philodendri]KAH3664097.1 hypothetical protein OGAPHI_004811 [Ogataea philodendri]